MKAFERGRVKARSGFTLVEIMIALAIVGTVVVLLLEQRVEAVRDAQKIHDRRIGWTLAAWKMSALELDDELLAGDNASGAGTFEDYSGDYAGFVWETEATREKIHPGGENNPDEEPREVFRVVLRIRSESETTPLVTLEGLFPAKEAGQ